MGSEYEVLLYHTEVRWLSRGKILKRLMALRTEVMFFLKEKECPLLEYFNSVEFIHGLAYLADIFGNMNEVNLSIQGPEVYIMDAAERLQALLGKLGLWRRRLEVGNYANFSMLEEVLLHDEVERNKPLSASLQNEMCEHLDTLQNSFTGYFSSGDLKVETWICNPFSTDVNSIDDSDLAKDDIIDLSTKEMLHCEFDSKSLGEFWCSLTQAYPRLAKRAMKALIPFATSYLCESGFSGLVNIKTKNRNRLDVQHDMRIALSNIIPEFHLLIEGKQQQSSH
ncbi:Protein ZBED8 isoform X1 [Oopsacas minuta]|uniref:Protein ZBED8 isoform X1 n=1 Tax=Oopsacas minuta TaxID=111878 RepID=A0AAV7JIE3_9METZ|nr:Protein ZBED8 isoform X1 [Oopsacas minuta]